MWTWRDSKRRDVTDPLTAASEATKIAAESVTELLQPMQRELRYLRVEVMVLREVIRNNGLPVPDPEFIRQLVADME